MSNDLTDQHERLRTIVGDWATSGHVISEPPVPISGSDIYELLPGGYFLVHHVDVTVGDAAVRAIEIIGEPGPEPGTFLARSYDHEGNVEIMRLAIDDDAVFHFSGGPDIAPAAQPADTPTARVRSTLSVAPDGQSMSALWERSDDGTNWTPWMDMTFQRRSSSGG
jgi:hypothetical protein